MNKDLKEVSKGKQNPWNRTLSVPESQRECILCVRRQEGIHSELTKEDRIEYCQTYTRSHNSEHLATEKAFLPVPIDMEVIEEF